MTAEEQRIAIAEACGWVHCYKDDNGLTGYPPDITSRVLLPQYLFDLNAMYEAEEVLSVKQAYVYADFLSAIQIVDSRWIGSHGIHATAAQCAEAFLRAVGKWKDQSSQ